jgi:Spy/CpxP family protein refolding chaperone
MNRLAFALGLSLALGGLTTAPASATPGAPPHAHGHGHGYGDGPSPDEVIARHAQELGIDAGTLERIRALGEQHRAEREVIVAALREQKGALRRLMETGAPNEAEAVALARKIGTLETDLSVARLESVIRIHALLTPEQNAALREKMRGRFVERRALLGAVSEACAAEIAEHCAAPEDAGHPGAPVRCLLHKRATEGLAVGAGCEAALRELPPPRMHRFPAPPPPGAGSSDVLVPAPPDAEGEE